MTAGLSWSPNAVWFWSIRPRAQAVETGLEAVAVTTDGAFAVNFTQENGQENSTAVEIIDVASGQRVTTSVDGVLLDFVEHTDGNIALLRRAGDRSGDTDVLILDPHDGTVRSVKPLGDLSAATSPELVSSARGGLRGRGR